MHNGQIGGFINFRRKIEALIDDRYYHNRHGTTDSEAIFYIMLSEGLENDPISATKNTLTKIIEVVDQHQPSNETLLPIRFTAALTDGVTVYCFRYANDKLAPSLYSHETENGIVIASEPFDSERARWQLIPDNTAVIAKNSQLELHEFKIKEKMVSI